MMDETKLEEYIQNFHKNGNDALEYVGQISTALVNRDLQLVTVVEKLGWLLSSEDKSYRSKGLSLLVYVLQDADQNLFSDKEVESLVTFFCSRLSDHHDFLPMTLQGLLILSSSPNLKESDVHLIARSIFSQVHTAAQLQEDRRKVYTIICNLLDKHLSGLQAMGSEFLLSYIQTMDGERDPRCLLMAFRIVTILAKTFELEDNVEDLFEVVACYFPVDFRAPAEDLFGVNREELSEALEESLTSTSLFAPFFLPLVLEKFTSELDSAKLDALSALQRFASSYGSIGLRNELKNIWSAFRREVFSGKDEAISKACLKCLSTIVSCLAEEDSVPFAESVWKECSQVIQGDSELAVVSASLVQAVFSGVPKSLCQELLNNSIPHLTQVLKETEGSQRLSHLQAFTTILDVPPLDLPGSWSCSTECWSLLLSLLYPEEDDGKVFNTNSYSWLAIERLLKLGSQLPESQMQELVLSVLTYANREHNSCATKKAIVAACTKLVETNGETAQVHFLLNSLFRHIGGLADDIFIAVCATSPRIAETQILDPLVMNYLSDNIHEETLCKCLVSFTSTQKGTDSHQHIIESYLYPLIGQALLDIYSGRCGSEDRPLYYAIESTVAVLSPLAALQLAQELLLVVIKNQSSGKWNKLTPVSFESLSSNSQSAISQVMRSVLPHLPPSSEPCSFHDAVRWLVFKALTHDDNNCNISQTVAGLANKCSYCGQLSFDVIKKCEMNSNTVSTLVWLTKALLLSGHSSTKEAADMLLDFLADPSYGSKVAKEFETILRPVGHVLKPSSHARVALFHSQRFFSLTAPRLLASYHIATKETRCNYLKALCCQLKYLPIPVLKQELPPLLPVLVATLDENQENHDADLLVSSLDALCLLLGSENLNLAFSHLSILIPRLIKLSGDQRTMKIRIGVLRCLYELTSLPTDQALLYSSEVLRSLRICLDDKKRLVRKEAARTACRWHLVGKEPSE